GTQTAGSPFLLLTFLLATQKKSELPPGNPRLAGSTSIASTGNGVDTRCRKTRMSHQKPPCN
ncbi:MULTISPECIES: hypothetical protein, partial [unclassified Polaromonas]|uniref:hypothetical protein n=1 Tax=unclassified Polaromonas TaxID=2638319 RepID=UPI0025DFE1DC